MLSLRSILVAPSLVSLMAIGLAQAEDGKETARSSYLTVNGKTNGFCGMTLLEIDDKPAACFGLHQPEGAKARYTYMILFKPNPKGHRGLASGGEGTSTIDGENKVACDLKLSSTLGEREIKFEYKLDAEGAKINHETLRVGGKEYGKDGPRVFLVDLGAEKLAFQPIKIIPQVVPDFADEDAWDKKIMAAVEELKEKSKEVRAFFGDNEKVALPAGEPPQFFVVTAVNKEGLVLQRRYPPTKEVDAPAIIEFKPAFKAIKARTTKGALLTPEEVVKRATAGHMVLVSEDENAVDPAFLAIIKEDTVILSGVLPQKGATGARVE